MSAPEPDPEWHTDLGPDQQPVSFTLRPASLCDLDEIWAIEAAVFASDAWSRDLMRDELSADHRVYLVLEAPELTGAQVAGAQLTGAESQQGTRPAIGGYVGVLIVGDEADIQTIAVVPELRGRGAGKQLMLAALSAAVDAGARGVFLEVRADNPVAQGLYTSLGFTELGVRPRYYQPDGVDAIVMKCELKEQR